MTPRTATFPHQVLVVGGGLAGLTAAIEAAEQGLDVAVLSHVHPVRSHSGAAQGGINASLGNAEQGRDDDWEKHTYDTIRGSDYLADQDAVEIAIKDAPLRVYQSEHWGMPYSRTADGRIAQRPFGGAGFPRTCYAADKTGHMLLQTMFEQCVKRNIKVYWDWMMLRLAADTVCRGVVAMYLPTGELATFPAEAVIFATGGAGRIYRRTTNALVSSGYGMAAAYRAGVPLKDMEFIQFHPTSLTGTNILMSEAARGEGAYLVNRDGERFMQRYAPSVMELAPRDIVSRSIQTEIDEHRGVEDGECVFLDIRHLGRERILEALPGIRDIAVTFAGIDPIDHSVPIQPAQHYTMGGIDTNVNGATQLPRFFAAGECGCVSIHGANRLGGNSLMETIIIGPRAGSAAVAAVLAGEPASGGAETLRESLEAEEAHLSEMLRREGTEYFTSIRDELAITMTAWVGIFREDEPLRNAVAVLEGLSRHCRRAILRHRGQRYNLELVRALETEAMLDVAQTIVTGALARKESRGSHSRTDFPQRDDANWLMHTIAKYTGDGPELSYQPVTITRWQPQERRY
jgi:succinate dehydrogenase / fumarate reductase, flavoprotein subunit